MPLSAYRQVMTRSRTGTQDTSFINALCNSTKILELSKIKSIIETVDSCGAKGVQLPETTH